MGAQAIWLKCGPCQPRPCAAGMAKQPATRGTGGSHAAGGSADSGVAAALMSLSLRTIAGNAEGMVLCVSEDTTLDALRDRAAPKLGCAAEDLSLCLGARAFGSHDLPKKLAELGIYDNAELTCILQIAELTLDAGAKPFWMVGADGSPDIAYVAMDGFLNNYRFARRTVGFAEAAAGAREARRNAMETPESAVVRRGCAGEGKDVAANYERRRRTVEFAKRAAAEREARFQSLVAAVTNETSGCCCVGSLPPLPSGVKADARWHGRRVEVAAHERGA
eukprot:NODE_2431_length_936_cov_230.053348.p1 GENE.NODE_2431_length_936_cov_230.053348~~NODE_2431_length_936_cov_230.053348.p1  ORF type:complete len:278 (-),score=18.12 NODE_2431_length_936_cov_230.053348:85-918(-)